MIGKAFNILFGVIFIIVGAVIIKEGGGNVKGFPVTSATGVLLCFIGIVEFIVVFLKHRKKIRKK
jgi:uncharacterized membrane protein